jgi:hypothetical protein
MFLLAMALLSLFAVSHAAAQKTEITYMAWYNTTQSEAADIQATFDFLHLHRGPDRGDLHHVTKMDLLRGRMRSS